MDAIKHLADIVTEEWGESDAANVVYEWLEAQEQAGKGGAMNELDAIKARREAITPGVWNVELRETVENGESFLNAVVTTNDADIAGLGAEEQCHADAAFIAAAPADVDTLLAMVERLTARAEEAEALLAGSPADTLAWALDKREQELREARREVDRLTGENANAKAALVAAAALLHQSNAEVDRLTGEVAAERDAAKRHAAYIASCVDECGSYIP